MIAKVFSATMVIWDPFKSANRTKEFYKSVVKRVFIDALTEM